MKLSRFCGICHSIILYTNKGSWYNANLRNSKCLKCSTIQGSITKKTGIYESCLSCGEPFYQTKSSNRKFCSRVCRDNDARKPLLEFKCEFCQGSFYRKKKDNRKNRPLKFCSVRCVCLSNIQSGKNHCRRKKTQPERHVEQLLIRLNISFVEQFSLPYKTTWKLFDFYIPESNILLEVDGIYWHAKGLSEQNMNITQRKNRKNDKIKSQLARKKGFKLIRIWEDEISLTKLEELLNV